MRFQLDKQRLPGSAPKAKVIGADRQYAAKEDLLDLAAYKALKDEPTVPFDEVIKELDKKHGIER
jgi:hypothetical protein